MGFLSRKSETAPASLDEVVDSLPRQVATWTPEQRAAYTAASNRTMREQNDDQSAQ